jgi:hypothetical protein
MGVYRPAGLGLDKPGLLDIVIAIEPVCYPPPVCPTGIGTALKIDQFSLFQT